VLRYAQVDSANEVGAEDGIAPGQKVRHGFGSARILT
jgi:hypothetical protein